MRRGGGGEICLGSQCVFSWLLLFGMLSGSLSLSRLIACVKVRRICCADRHQMIRIQVKQNDNIYTYRKSRCATFTRITPVFYHIHTPTTFVIGSLVQPIISHAYSTDEMVNFYHMVDTVITCTKSFFIQCVWSPR